MTESPDNLDYLSGLPDPVIEINETGQLVGANDRASELFGESKSHLMGLYLNELLGSRALERRHKKLNASEIDEIQYPLDLEGADRRYRATERSIDGQQTRLVVFRPVLGVQRTREDIEDALIASRNALTRGNTFYDRAHRLLRIGCQRLNMPIGMLTHVEDSEVKILVTCRDGDDIPVSDETTFDLDGTHTGAVLEQSNKEIVAPDTEDWWAGEPPDRPAKFAAYIGQKVRARGGDYGVVAFADTESVRDHFVQIELSILDLLTEIMVWLVERRGSKQELRKFFNLSADLLCIANTDGEFERVNPAFTRILGYDENTILNTPFLEFVHPDDREATRKVMSQLADGELLHDFRNRYIAKDGSLRWLSWRAVPNRAKERIYAVARDLTEQQEIEELKDEFISVVNHELRTPLSSTKGALQLALELHGDEMSESLEEFVEMAFNSTDRLERLVDDMLSMEEIKGDTIALSYETVSPVEILEYLAEELRISCQEQNIELQTNFDQTELQIRVDRDRLYQVVNNLVSNAIKFSPSSSEVTIGLKEIDNREIQVSVEDEGPGIPKSFQDQVFERFTQADGSDSREQGGSGLGLAIARELTEKMGGRINYTTKEGEGTIFRVIFPAAH
jgi:PAS domain S-box-containing protein